MNVPGRSRAKSVLMSSWKLPLLGGSETRPTWSIRMMKVLKKNTPGEVVKIDNRTSATAVTTKVGHLESVGHWACDLESPWKVYARGKVVGKAVLLIP